MTVVDSVMMMMMMMTIDVSLPKRSSNVTALEAGMSPDAVGCIDENSDDSGKHLDQPGTVEIHVVAGGGGADWKTPNLPLRFRISGHSPGDGSEGGDRSEGRYHHCSCGFDYECSLHFDSHSDRHCDCTGPYTLRCLHRLSVTSSCQPRPFTIIY